MRIYLLLLFLGLMGCSGHQEILLPQVVGEWKQVSVELVPDSGDGVITRDYRYEGSAAVSVTTHQYKSGTVAFEKFQQWKVEPNTLPFHQGSLLIVPKGEDREVLRRFSDVLQPMLR